MGRRGRSSVLQCAVGIGVALGLGPGHAPLAVALAPLDVVTVSDAIAAGATWLARRQGGGPAERWRRIGRDVVEAIPVGLRELPASARRSGR